MRLKTIFLRAMQKCKQATTPALFYFLAGFLLSVFTWHQTAASNDNSSKEALCKEDLTAIFAYHSICSDLQLHLPFESAPAPKDREVPDENELEEDFDYELYSVLEEQAFESISDLPESAKSFIRLNSNISNGIQVPLFILYHSWKSFMS